MKTRILAFVLLFAAVLPAVDMNRTVAAPAIAIQNSTAVSITCPLEGATMIQVYIRSGDEQVYTLTLPNTTTIEVPSGLDFVLRLPPRGCDYGQELFTAITATDGATLQVIGVKER